MKEILKANKNKIFVALANFLCMCALIYIFAVLISSEHIETERAELEARRDIINLTAYIFRNEEIIYAGENRAGAVYLVENGEKVARRQAVARVNRGGEADMDRAAVEALENRLSVLRRSNINLEYAAASLSRVNRDSNELYLEMLRNVQNNNMGAAVRSRDEKLVLLNKRQLITGYVENFTGIIRGLESELARAQGYSGEPAAAGMAIYAGRSGVFYWRVDGLERYFTGYAARDLDLARFEELISREPDDNIISRAVGKVAYDYVWYFVSRARKSELEGAGLAVGRRYEIISPYSSNRVIAFTLRSFISDRDSGDALLVFETNIAPCDFNFLRRQSIQVVAREVRGIRVPDRAVKVRQVIREWEEDDDGGRREVARVVSPEIIDGEAILGEMITGVYVLSGSQVLFRRLDSRDKIAQFDGYALYAEPGRRVEGSTTSLQPFEDIIVVGRNLYDRKVIN